MSSVLDRVRQLEESPSKTEQNGGNEHRDEQMVKVDDDDETLEREHRNRQDGGGDEGDTQMKVSKDANKGVVATSQLPDEQASRS